MQAIKDFFTKNKTAIFAIGALLATVFIIKRYRKPTTRRKW